MTELIITSSVLILVIILMRRLLKGKISLRLQYALWALVLIRLIIPITLFKSPISVMNAVERSAAYKTAGQTLSKTKVYSDVILNSEMTPDEAREAGKGALHEIQGYPKQSGYANLRTYIFMDSLGVVLARILRTVWLAGIVVFGLTLLLSNLSFSRKLRKTRIRYQADNCERPVYLVENLPSPCLFGLFRPVIYITPDVAGDSSKLRYVLAHEQTHYRHGDHIWAAMRGLCLAVYWYNPLVWLAAKLSRRDSELACDEGTIKHLGEASRMEYGRALIGLTCEKRKTMDLLCCATTMTDGKKGIRERVTLIARRPKVLMPALAAVALIAAAAVGCTFTGAKSENTEIIPQSIEDEADNRLVTKSVDGSSVGSNESDSQTIYGEITKIGIYYEKTDYKGTEIDPIQITDSKIISDIVDMISQSEAFSNDQLNKMRPMTKTNNKMILTLKDGSKKEFMFAYDDLYNLGYVQINEELLDPGYDFFRYLDDYIEYRRHDTSIDSKVSDLFSKYGWTADYLVNSVKVTLPSDLKHQAGDFPLKLYWAYNNELSKSVGLDFGGYLGERVNAEIYRLREPLPDFMKPRYDARGIIIKHSGEIIGAYIDAGRHSGFACSLDSKSLKDVTGKDWRDWIDGFIDYSDKIETKLSSMSPEELIRQYFEAMNKHDEKMLLACMTRENLCSYLFANMDNNLLYNSDSASVYSDVYSNVKSVKLIDMSELKDIDNPDGIIEYQVTVDYNFKKTITSDSGIQQRFVLLMKETEKGGWRISGVGTGP